MANVGAGIALIVFGFMMAVFGAVTYSSCRSAPTLNGVAPDCGGFGLVTELGILLGVIGVVVTVILALLQRTSHRRTPFIQQVPDPSLPPPIIPPVVTPQAVEKEVVQVRCSFCGNLFDGTAKACPWCGAPFG